MGEKRGMKALEAWCRRVVEGYRDVALDNMTTSWRDGLAFCALIHHFRPDLIDYDALSKENILHNNQLAFSVAEKHLGIPALLEAEDMVQYKVPDKLSIMTYVSQFYQHFQGTGQSKTPAKPAKRPLESSSTSSTPSPESPPGKIASLSAPSSTPQRHDVCQACKHRVYILERLIIDSKLYHRTCFKCCRCESVLKPGSYVDGQKSGEYECVSCPDEEEAEKAAIATMAAARIAHQKSPTSPESLVPLRFQRPTKSESVRIISTEIAKARSIFLSHETEEPVKSKEVFSVAINNKNIQLDTQNVEEGHNFNSESSDGIGKSNSILENNEKMSSDVTDSVELCAVSKEVVSPISSTLHSSDTKGEDSVVSVISKEPNTDTGSSTVSTEKISMQLEIPLSSELTVDKLSPCNEQNIAEKDSNDTKLPLSISKCEIHLQLESKLVPISPDEDGIHNESETKTLPVKVTSHLTPAFDQNEKRPIPSPRSHRKKSLSPVPSGKEKQNDDSEIFLTPLSSPKLRKKQGLSMPNEDNSKDDTHNQKHRVDPRTKHKPLPKARPSRLSSPPPKARPSRLSSPPLSPSKTGVVVADMPVIRPQISERMLSPTRQKPDKKNDLQSSPSKSLDSKDDVVTVPMKNGLQSNLSKSLKCQEAIETLPMENDQQSSPSKSLDFKEDLKTLPVKNDVRSSPMKSLDSKQEEETLPMKKRFVHRRKSLELPSQVEERQRSGGTAESRAQSYIDNTRSLQGLRRSSPSRNAEPTSATKSDTSLSKSVRTSTSSKTEIANTDDIDCALQSKNSTPKKVPPPRPLPPVFSKSASMTLPCRQQNSKSDRVYPEDLNPFNDDDEDVENKATAAKLSSPTSKEKSLNPFEDSDDEDEYSLAPDVKLPAEIVTSTPKMADDDTTAQKSLQKIIPAPKGLNPFLSDDDEDDDEVCQATNHSSLVPNQRVNSSSQLSLNATSLLEKPTPLPRKSLDGRSASVSPAGSLGKQNGRKYAGSPTESVSKTSVGAWYSPAESPTDTPAGSLSKATGGKHLSSKDSGLDISPTGSISKGHGHRKKRPAPKPPSTSTTSGDKDSRRESSPVATSPKPSNRRSPRLYKRVPAPPPPTISTLSDETNTSTADAHAEVNEKALKEMDNMSLKSAGVDESTCEKLENSGSIMSDQSVNKSEKSIDRTPTKSKTTFGYWKKKKPAPPVPLPPKRQTKLFLSMEEITQELAEIEEKHLELERQGVELEKAIREGSTGEDEFNAEEDDLVIQLFELVNQKNALFRRQAELVYIKRQQRLEEEHAELEFQIRCLMSKPENLKTEDDKEQEEELINHLMDVVMQRNQIIESMENDRLREALEDQSIQEQMAIHQGIAGSSRNSLSSQESNSLERTTKKDKKKKDKTLKLKNKEKEKSKNMDEDKDLDEVEVAMKAKNKKDKKRRWF